MTHVNNLSGYVSMGDASTLTYTMVGGVAKPANETVLKQFKALQTQVNRVLKVKGFPVIGVDGDIGPGTVAAVQKVQTAAKADLTAGKLADTRAAQGVALIRSSTPEGIADAIVANVANIGGYADQLHAPTSVSSPKPATTPAVYNPVTGLSSPQPAAASAMDAWNRLGSTSQMAVVGALGLVGVLLATSKRKGKKGKARR